MRRARRQIGQQQGAAGTKVDVTHIEVALIERREPVAQLKGACRGLAELDDAIAEVRAAVVTAVTGSEVGVKVGVSGTARSAHPYTAVAAVGSGVPNGLLCERTGVVRHHPPVEGAGIALGSPAYNDVAILKEQCRALE